MNLLIKRQTMTKSSIALASALLFLSISCGGDDDSPTTPRADASVAFVCDPVGSNAEMSALLNAELDQGVEVIEKTPTHPGDPGPLDLP